MTTLKRSNVSFRRQGSSGRIWHDPLGVPEPKSCTTNYTSRTQKRAADQHLQLQDYKRNEDKKFNDSRMRDEGCSMPGSNRDQGCSFCDLFGRCMGPPKA